MSRRFRTVLTIIFAVGFLITAPVVLFYTAGYRYDLRKHRLQKTGLIQTDSVPDGATVLLNGVDTGRLTPSPLARLLPEQYHIRYEKPGYMPWEKDIEVWSGATTFVTDAVLIADADIRGPKPLATRLPKFSPDGTRLAYLSNDDDEIVVRWIALEERSEQASGSNVVPGSSIAEVELSWSPTSKGILIAQHAAGGDLITLIDADNANEPPLSPKLPAGRFVSSWSDDGTNIVLVSSSGILLIDAQTGSITGPFDSSAIAATLYDDQLYVLKTGSDSVLLEKRTANAGAVSKLLTNLPLGTYRFLDVTGPALVLSDLLRGKIFVIDPDDGRLIDQLDATSVRWHESGQAAKLLAWNDYQLTILTPAIPERVLVTRLGARIESCAWHPSGLAVFYMADGEPFAVDLDAREPKNVVPLAPDHSFDDLTVDIESEMLRFVDVTGVYERPF